MKEEQLHSISAGNYDDALGDDLTDDLNNINDNDIFHFTANMMMTQQNNDFNVENTTVSEFISYFTCVRALKTL